MRYAYAITTALVLGGSAAAMTIERPALAQTALNSQQQMAQVMPRYASPPSFAPMVEKLAPAVVNISTMQKVKVQQNPFAGTPFGDMFGFGQGDGDGGDDDSGSGSGGSQVTRPAESLGSGFIISPDGYIVTNNHVISAGSANAVVQSITVTLTNNREYKAKLIGRDKESDLAVLKIDGHDLPYVKFGDSKSARVGDWVIAIGNPYGLGGTVTQGIISAVHRVTGQGAYDRFIQTDASINRGNSGGPMFDMQGNVIGINSQILSPTGGNIGIGFAIPAEEAKPIIDTLMKGGTVKRGYLGVTIQPVTDDIAEALNLPKNHGELITHVEPSGPAEKAGIKQGDVIVQVDGKDVTPDQTLSYLVANQAPGSTVPVTLLRDGKRKTVSVTLATRPPEDQLEKEESGDNGDGLPDDNGVEAQSPASALGVQVVPLTPQIARSVGVDPSIHGVVIASVDPSSDAAAKGLKRGDVIVSANRDQVTSAAELGRAIQQAKAAGRDQILLFVQRRGIGAYTAVQINKGK